MRAGLVVLILAGCSPSPSPPVNRALAVGANLPSGRATAVGTILAHPDDYAGKTLLVEGKVRAACRKRGCWMEIGDQEGDSCRVRFKDYGFFVPTDAAGAFARLSGEVKLRSIPKEEVAHLEGEGATLHKAPDGSASVVEITATGVELIRM